MKELLQKVPSWLIVAIIAYIALLISYAVYDDRTIDFWPPKIHSKNEVKTGEENLGPQLQIQNLPVLLGVGKAGDPNNAYTPGKQNIIDVWPPGLVPKGVKLQHVFYSPINLSELEKFKNIEFIIREDNRLEVNLEAKKAAVGGATVRVYVTYIQN